jgi:hypothetical protein
MIFRKDEVVQSNGNILGNFLFKQKKIGQFFSKTSGRPDRFLDIILGTLKTGSMKSTKYSLDCFLKCKKIKLIVKIGII